MIYEFGIMDAVATLEANDFRIASAAMIAASQTCLPVMIYRPVEATINLYGHLTTIEAVAAAMAVDFPPDFLSYLKTNKPAIQAAIDSIVAGTAKDRPAMLAKRGQ